MIYKNSINELKKLQTSDSFAFDVKDKRLVGRANLFARAEMRQAHGVHPIDGLGQAFWAIVPGVIIGQ